MIPQSSSNCLKLLNGVAVKLHNFQSVRYRKPSWLPRAKSKMFKVVPRRVIPIEEELELRRLHNIYRTRVKSIRAYLELQWKEKPQENVGHDAEMRKFEQDFQRSLLINKEWSEELKPERESFFANELQNKLDFELKRVEERKAKEQAELEDIEALVREVKADSKGFITADNIDESIDKVLESHEDYNYAINLKGEKIM